MSILALALVTQVTTIHVDLDTLRRRIEARIAQDSGAVVGVVYRPLDGRPTLSIAPDSIFHAASTMKVPVMIELYRQASTGAFTLDQPILLVNKFRSIADGSPFSTDAGDDSDSSMYARIGSRVPVRELLEHMITRSSNLATNVLIELVGAQAANATAHALGAKTIRVLRGVEDTRAFERGMNNATSAADLAALMAAIAEGRAVSPRASNEMRDVLLRQEFNEKIPGGLPAGTRVAHKTGEISTASHDAAIVYPASGSPYVLVVLTRNVGSGKKAATLIADISRLVWEARTGTAASSEQ